MTNLSRILLISIALTVLGAVTPASLQAAKGGGQPITIGTITPNAAYQGDTGVPVNLKGSGFGPRAKVVFLEKGTEFVGDIAVRDVVFDDASGDLNFMIDVGSEAKIIDYEVEVTVAGRKGKGTTFTVRERLHQNVEVGCDEFARLGTCNCRFMLDPDTRIFNLLGDCETSETLWLDDARIFSIDGGSNGVWPTLTAVECDGSLLACEYKDDNGVTQSFAGRFHGSSVIANGSDVAGVRYFKIRFDDGVLRGCISDSDGPDIQSAISFVLDGGTYDDPGMNSFLQVWDMDIDSQTDPLCTAIEVLRYAEFTRDQPGNRDWKVSVETSFVAGGSYVQSAIRVEGMQPQQSINPPSIFGNYIGAPACVEPGQAQGILFGRLLLSDPSTQVAGVVESNIIRMANTCGSPSGVGIGVVGEDAFNQYRTAAEIIKNDISGASFGVVVDGDVDGVHFSGNTLTGDWGDIGICSEASSTSTKGKPNVWSGYDTGDEILYEACVPWWW